MSNADMLKEQILLHLNKKPTDEVTITLALDQWISIYGNAKGCEIANQIYLTEAVPMLKSSLKNMQERVNGN